MTRWRRLAGLFERWRGARYGRRAEARRLLERRGEEHLERQRLGIRDRGNPSGL